ncbi:MAG: hypothetical protein FJ087_01155 [Deltaproteobacteria bacterium]|nr:hypothetical protein [Deltaproteobacteria bacterium]
MAAANDAFRYEMVNVRPGYIVVEHERFSNAMRSYFSTEDTPPVEEYREGAKVWKYSGFAQSFRFDVMDRETGETHPFADLLGLVWWAGCRDGSEPAVIGDVAADQKVQVYVALTWEGPDGRRAPLAAERLKVLNRYFNERIREPGKKILILPDCFDLGRQFSYGQVMVDLGLTALD